MISTQIQDHSDENSIDPTLHFLELVKGVEKELLLLQTELAKVRGLVDTRLRFTSPESIRLGGQVINLLGQLLPGLVEVQGKLFEILYNSNC